jgi:hypothetical protein
MTHTTRKTVNVTINGLFRSLYLVAYSLRVLVSHCRAVTFWCNTHVIGMDANMLTRL